MGLFSRLRPEKSKGRDDRSRGEKVGANLDIEYISNIEHPPQTSKGEEVIHSRQR